MEEVGCGDKCVRSREIVEDVGETLNDLTTSGEGFHAELQGRIDELQ